MEKRLTVDGKEYIVNKVDALTSLSLLPTCQRITKVFDKKNPHVDPVDTHKDLNNLLLSFKILRLVGTKEDGGIIAPDVVDKTQLPSTIEGISDLALSLIDIIYEDRSAKKT